MDFPKASIGGNGRVVFGIHGGAFRLIVKIEFRMNAVFIRFFGTHSVKSSGSSEKLLLQHSQIIYLNYYNSKNQNACQLTQIVRVDTSNRFAKSLIGGRRPVLKRGNSLLRRSAAIDTKSDLPLKTRQIPENSLFIKQYGIKISENDKNFRLFQHLRGYPQHTVVTRGSWKHEEMCVQNPEYQA